MKQFVLAFASILIFQAALAVSPEKNAQCDVIARAYNRCEQHVNYNAAENRFDLLKLGSTVPCDDGLQLSFLQRLRNPDVSSMLMQKYTRGKIDLPVTEVDFSPGSIRNQEFMKAVYGADKASVRANLINVEFLGQSVRFNRMNGAAHQLSLVGQELMDVYNSGKNPELNKFLDPFLGRTKCLPEGRCHLLNYTFDWRVVKDTTALSNHSFGTAIDLQPPSGTQYWVWDLEAQIKAGHAEYFPGADPKHFDPHMVSNFQPKTNAKYPQKLAEVFENHGFVWGGKWYRYDIMHFEFHPELFPDEGLACE